MSGLKWIAFFMAGWTVVASAQTSVPEGLERVGDEVRLPGLRIVGGEKGYLEATGKMSTTNDVLEFVAVQPLGREYESLVTLDCKPSSMKFGLLLLGCEEGLTNGSLLDLHMEWQEKGKNQSASVESFIIDRKTGKAPTPMPFFLSGSFFGKDLFTTNQIFHSDTEQAHIALWWQPAIIINVRTDNGNPYRADNQGYSMNSKVMPPTGTPIKLIIRKKD